MPFINDNTLDNGLTAIKSGADRMYINSSEPATYTAATSTAALGNKTVAQGALYPAAIGAGTPSGRQIDSLSITDGSVTTSGSATHNSAVNSVASRLELAQALSSSQAVTATNVFTLASQRLRLPNLAG